MRLLDKRVVNVEVATQKKLQIDEGLLMAKKVDAVRETLQIEEKELREFRTQTTAQVQKDIDALISVKDGLLKDVKDAKEAKRIAQIPLDAEWEKVKQERLSLESLKQELLERGRQLGERVLQVAKREKEAMEETARIEGLKKQAEDDLAAADVVRSNANEYSARIRNEAQAVLSSAELVETGVLAREARVTEREQKATQERGEIIKNYDDIAQKSVLIQDREETVARDVQRLQDREQSLIIRFSAIEEREANIDAYVANRTKEAEAIESEIETLLVRKRDLTESVTQAQEELTTMKAEEKAAAKRISASNETLSELEKDISIRLQAVEQRESLADEKEKDLSVRERRLIDQYASLAKATEQVKKQHG